ncbi:RIP metalloprotease [Patescibacteria group bacterium]
MLLTIIVFGLTLSILILVHELGHFLVAKKFGIKVEEFGFGYPPRFWGKKVGETIYSINWIPFGGFVRLFGEETAVKKEKERSFWFQKKRIRVAVIAAGVIANILLAWGSFTIVYSSTGIPTKTDKIKIVGIAPGSVAEQVGLGVGDQIMGIRDLGGEDVYWQGEGSLEAFIKNVGDKKGESISLIVGRPENNPCLGETAVPAGASCQGERMIFSLTPRENPAEGEGPLGVVVSSFEMKKYPWWQMPYLSAIEGAKETFGWVMLVFGGVGAMISNLVTSGQVPQDLAGPIGILQVTSTVSRAGILAILQFVGILSANLAVVNILPIPALDGGKLFFLLVETITGRRQSAKFEQALQYLGMVLILALMVLITINDVRRALTTTVIGGQLRSLWPF